MIMHSRLNKKSLSLLRNMLVLSFDLVLVRITVVQQCITEVVAHRLEVSGAELIASHLAQQRATKGSLHGEAVGDTHLSPHHYTTSTLLAQRQ